MDKKQQIAVRIEKTIAKKLDTYCKKTGTKKQHVVQKAIDQYLN